MPISPQPSSGNLRRPIGRVNLAKAIGECDNNEYNHDIFECRFCDTTANQRACHLPSCPCGGRGLVVMTMTDDKKFKHSWQEGGGSTIVVFNKPGDWCNKMVKKWVPTPQHVALQSDPAMPPFLGRMTPFDGQTGNVAQVPDSPVVAPTFFTPGYGTPVAVPSPPFHWREPREESLPDFSWLDLEFSPNHERRVQQVATRDTNVGNYLPGQNIGQLSQGAPYSLTEHSFPEAMLLHEATVPADGSILEEARFVLPLPLDAQEWGSILEEARFVLPLPLDAQDWGLSLDEFTGLDLN